LGLKGLKLVQYKVEPYKGVYILIIIIQETRENKNKNKYIENKPFLKEFTSVF